MLMQQLLQLELVVKGLKRKCFVYLVMIFIYNQIQSDPSSQDVIQVFGKDGKAQKRT